MQHVPASDGVAGDHGDDRLGQATDLLLHIEDVETRDTIGPDIAAIAAHFLVSARAESLISLAGQNNHADRGVVTAMIESVLHFLDGLRTEGVADLGTVDRDFGDPVVRLLELQVGVVLDFVPDRFCHEGRKADRRGFRK
jgi:hypothetical protein